MLVLLLHELMVDSGQAAKGCIISHDKSTGSAYNTSCIPMQAQQDASGGRIRGNCEGLHRRAHRCICRDDIAAFQFDDISRHEFAHLQCLPVVIAPHHGRGSRELLHSMGAPCALHLQTLLHFAVAAQVGSACKP